MYAVIETGGKQYRVAPGQTVAIERLPIEVGEKVTLERVLFVARDEELLVGKPLVEGAKVHATIVAQDRGPKIIVFKYKPRERYRNKTGHRQARTHLRIEEIEVS